ncbi:alpha/beta hydrolase [Planktomarina temperata]|nr:alpha/beta hydrolase [Planktomarina temperata]
MNRKHSITGHGGVQLCVHDLGPETAPAIILVHGWSQCHLSFARQAALAEGFRLILPDLRGHGQSDKPLDPACYDNSRPWAEDMQAIITSLALDAPLLVGWSMGGWVVMDYLEHFGDAALAGVGLIGSSITTGAHLPPAAAKVRNDPPAKAVGMYSEDLAENLAAVQAFVSVCFHQQPDAGTLAQAVGYNMLVPPQVRAAARLRQEDRRAVAEATVKPAWVAWGAHERLAPAEMGQQALAHFPNAEGQIYHNSGHSPFWEEATAFNTDLAAFATRCFAPIPRGSSAAYISGGPL